MINQAIFPAPKPSSYTLDSYPGKLLHIPRKDTGTFTFGVFLPSPARDATRYMLVYAHPNAVDIGMMVGEMEYFSRKAQMDVLLFEYRGYGLCDGRPGEEEIDYDTEAVYDFVINELLVPPSRIILMGRSIGTGPLTKLAASLPPERSPAVLFLQAPFTSIKDCVASLIKGYSGGMLADFASGMVADRYRSIDYIGDTKCFVVIQHGNRDTIVAYDQGQRLAEAARIKKGDSVAFVKADGFGHNDLLVSDAVRALLENMQLWGLMGSGSPPLRVSLSAKWLCGMSLYSAFAREETSVVRSLVDGVCGSKLERVPSMLRDHTKLSLVLTCSTVVFAQRCAMLWHRCFNVWRRQSEADHEKYIETNGQEGNKEPFKPKNTVEEIVSMGAAVWGSPFGLYAELANDDSETVIGSRCFGVSFPFNTTEGPSLLPERTKPTPLFPLRVYKFPIRVERELASVVPGLLVKRANELLDSRLTLPQASFDVIQMEAERFVATLSDDDWSRISVLLDSHMDSSWLGAAMHSTRTEFAARHGGASDKQCPEVAVAAAIAQCCSDNGIVSDAQGQDEVDSSWVMADVVWKLFEKTSHNYVAPKKKSHEHRFAPRKRKEDNDCIIA